MSIINKIRKWLLSLKLKSVTLSDTELLVYGLIIGTIDGNRILYYPVDGDGIIFDNDGIVTGWPEIDVNDQYFFEKLEKVIRDHISETSRSDS